MMMKCNTAVVHVDDSLDETCTTQVKSSVIVSRKENVPHTLRTKDYNKKMDFSHKNTQCIKNMKRFCCRCSYQTLSQVNKNFNAFLSAIERVHLKDSLGACAKIESLVEYAIGDKERFDLNNSVNYCQSQSGDNQWTLSQQLLNGKNVDFICNNLSKSGSSEKDEWKRSRKLHRLRRKNGIGSYSDLTECLCSEQCDYCNIETTRGHEETTSDSDVLETGPSGDESDTDLDNVFSDTQERTILRAEVSVASILLNDEDDYDGDNRDESESKESNVCVDLEDTDISMTIQYHDDTEKSCEQSREIMIGHHGVIPMCCLKNLFYYPLGAYGWLPYSLPYCLVPMYYMPYPLYATVPKPICVPRSTHCLTSQRLCMVPAQEIKTCKNLVSSDLLYPNFFLHPLLSLK